MMPSLPVIVVLAGLLVLGVLMLVVWEKISPSRPTRRRRGATPSGPRPAAAPGQIARRAGPRIPVRSSTAPAEREPAIVDWEAHETSVRTLLRQREYREARRRITTALGDAGITTDRRSVFEDLQADTVGAEIGQLTAAAVRGSQQGEGPAVLASLEQAAMLLKEAGTALPMERREEIERRLWLAYTKVGTHRLEAGRFNDAADALVRALEFAGDDAARQAESCRALAKALRQLGEQPAGDQGEAQRFADELEAAAEGGSGSAIAATIGGVRALLTRQPRTGSAGP